METVQSSVLCQWLAPLWNALCRWYDASVLARLIRGIGAGIRAWCDGSALFHFAAREGTLTRAWPDSLLCRVLTFLLNIPTRLVQLIYEKCRTAFEGSFFAQLAFGIVESTPLAVAWLMLVVMVIPFKYWNNAYSLAGFILCFILAIFAGTRQKGWKLDLAAIGPWLVAFAGMVMVSWPLSAYSSQSARFLLYHVTCMLCVVVIVSTVERRDQLVRLMGAASLALGVMSISGFYQRANGIRINPSYVDMTLYKDMPGRVYAFYENPNTFAEVLLLLIPVAVALMLCSKGWFGRFLGFFSAALGCAAMIMTYSRASWLGLGVAVLVFLLLWKRKLIPAMIAVAVAALPFLPDVVFNRLINMFNLSDSSTSSRFPLYYAAGEFLMQRPLLGAGLGSDAVRSAISDLNLFHGIDHFVHCHNTYLQIWCETGLVGIISFVGGVLWTIKQGIRAVARSACHHQTRLAIIGGAAALAGSLVCGLADYLWNYPRVMLIFWFVCAIVVAGIRLAAREGKESILCAE